MKRSNRNLVRDGDVVIRKAGGTRFTLEIYPGRPQLLVGGYDAASQLARGFAAKARVAVWTIKKGVFAQVASSKASGVWVSREAPPADVPGSTTAPYVSAASS